MGMALEADPWCRREAMLAAILLLILIAAAGTDLRRRSADQPAADGWPPLLAAETAAVDPEIAVLRQRANIVLARLISSGQMAE